MIDAMDARTRRTIRKLENAFIDILETKNIDDVSVSEICSNAHVNRTTFYRYYRNQYALLEMIEKELFASLYTTDDIISLLTAMRKRKKEWKRIIHLKGRGCVAENLSVIFSDRIKSRFTVSGICGSIAWWIESDMKESPEAFGRYLSDASGFEL